jgi:hypothetical protein
MHSGYFPNNQSKQTTVINGMRWYASSMNLLMFKLIGFLRDRLNIPLIFPLFFIRRLGSFGDRAL